MKLQILNLFYFECYSYFLCEVYKLYIFFLEKMNRYLSLKLLSWYGIATFYKKKSEINWFHERSLNIYMCMAFCELLSPSNSEVYFILPGCTVFPPAVLLRFFISQSVLLAPSDIKVFWTHACCPSAVYISIKGDSPWKLRDHTIPVRESQSR